MRNLFIWQYSICIALELNRASKTFQSYYMYEPQLYKTDQVQYKSKVAQAHSCITEQHECINTRALFNSFFLP